MRRSRPLERFVDPRTALLTPASGHVVPGSCGCRSASSYKYRGRGCETRSRSHLLPSVGAWCLVPDLKTKRASVTELSDPRDQPAGAFSSWLRLTRRAQQLPTLGAEVPCGACNACCRASYFIHIKPEETQTLERIPKRLLFPAPGLPRGNVLMGYNENGECPVWIDKRCSIYEHRPQTCRDYDCRVFPATGIALDDDPARALIAERVRTWKFDYPGEVDRKEHAAVQAAARFLQDHREGFPPELRPSTPAQLAVLAIKVYEIFFQLDEGAEGTGQRPLDADIARAVMAAMEQPADGSQEPQARPSGA